MKSKLLTLLLSFVIAFGLWAYVVTVVSPESEETFYDVPVVLSGTSVLAERDLMILSDTQVTVDLKLMGNRLDLAKLNAGNITVLADLSQITDPGVHKVKYTISYPGDVQSGNIEVLERDPQYLTIEVVERGHKQIPVIPVYDLEQLPAGYWMDQDNISLSYNFITVSGPKSEVENIQNAQIQIDLTDKTSVFVGDYRISLCDADGPIQDVGNITVNLGEVRATVLIHELVQLPIRVELEGGDIFPAHMVTVSQSVSTLLVTGTKDALAQLEQEILLGTISLQGRDEDFTEVFQIELPKGVIVVEGSTTVEVSVDLPDVERVTVQFLRTDADQYDIVLMDLPEGFDIELQEFTFEIKGEKLRVQELANKKYLEADGQLHRIQFRIYCAPVKQEGVIKLKVEILIPGIEGVIVISPSRTLNCRVMLRATPMPEE